MRRFPPWFLMLVAALVGMGVAYFLAPRDSALMAELEQRSKELRMCEQALDQHKVDQH